MDDDRNHLDELHPAIRGLKTVCRCMNIKYRTIEKAISAGAVTVGEVARRTGATTGHCGGSCTPVIQKMIDRHAPPPAAPAPAEGEEDAWWVRPAGS
jgi:NAD(P)H-nitrite reductase large subunit